MASGTSPPGRHGVGRSGSSSTTDSARSTAETTGSAPDEVLASTTAPTFSAPADGQAGQEPGHRAVVPDVRPARRGGAA